MIDNLTKLLEIKQGHTNAIEARFAHDQAEQSEKQASLILVFTVVTIIFVPLSFLAAFFAISINEFPKDDKEDNALSLDWVAKYIFGVGLTFSFLVIIVSVFIIYWSRISRLGNRCLRKQVNAKRDANDEGTKGEQNKDDSYGGLLRTSDIEGKSLGADGNWSHSLRRRVTSWTIRL